MPECDALRPNATEPSPKRRDDSAVKTLLVALVTATTAGFLVTGTSLWLRPIQAANQNIDIMRNVLEVAGIEAGEDIRRTFIRQVRVRMVDLETGEYTSAVDPVEFDPQAAAKDPEISRELPRKEDVAEIGRRANYARVYLVLEDGDDPKAIVLPLTGYAYSEMSALIALANDANTILGFKAYNHDETPGLGGRVDDPAWRAQWKGKVLRDDLGHLRFQVISPEEGLEDQYRVDAISGATVTSEGVQNIIHFWIGDYGYGPYLSRLRKGEGI
jgi:Na+-transporting NADH:ubiquinone oxidoreductase subunit C